MRPGGGGACNKVQKSAVCNDHAQLTWRLPRLHDSCNRANPPKIAVFCRLEDARGGGPVAGGPGAEYGCVVVDFSTATNRGSGWAALALGSRLALGAAASIFLNFPPRICADKRGSISSAFIRVNP